MTNTSGADSVKTGKLSKIKTAALVLLVTLAAILMLGLPALGNSGVLDTVGGVIVASASYSEDASVYHDYSGPVLKNWQCRDNQRGWRGLWRYTKAGAVIDCASYNQRL